MLTYLINVTNDILLLSLVMGLVYAFIAYFCSDRGILFFRSGVFLGFIAAAIRAYITNTRRLVGGWRVGVYGYVASLILILLLFLAALIFGKAFFYKRDERISREHIIKAEDEEYKYWKDNFSELVICLLTGLMCASFIYSSFNNIYVYPFKFKTGGNGIISTDYLFRLGGYLLGLAECLLSAICAYRIVTVMAKKGYRKVPVFSFIVAVILFGVYIFAKLMLVLVPRKIVKSMALFMFAAASNNNSEAFSYILFILLITISIFMWVLSYTKKEAYFNNAQHRKQKALWRKGKRASIFMLLCFILCILCATWFVELNKVVIREAPVEEPLLIKDALGNDKELRVDISLVSDGHLHRFGYTTADGYHTRFIVVLKVADTMNYGIGLDACEICGEAGYYENKEGQVVCKKCNVVMNRTTIGMKGGCNPIIIDYDINEQYITVPVADLIKNQSRFSR